MSGGIIQFNFTPEQQERFNLILDETKKLHPHLMVDDISKERIKVLIAYSVINNDKILNDDKPLNEENVFTEIKD
jgi:hypothetical protein